MTPHERLVERALSGVADDAELAALAQCLHNPVLAKAFVTEVGQRTTLIQALRQADAGSAVLRVVKVKRRAPLRPPSRSLPIALAAGLAACLVAGWMLWPHPPVTAALPVPIVIESPTKIGGDYAAAAGEQVAVPVTAIGWCMLRGPAQLKWRREGEDDVLALVAGTVELDLPPRQRGALRIRTEQAEVTVVGTAFTVSTATGTTRVAVTRGTVRVRSGTQNRAVVAGESVVADGVTVGAPTVLPVVAQRPTDKSTAAESVPQRQPDFMPIGLHWAGKFVHWNAATDQPDWAKVDVALADMARRSVNALWITHLSPTQTAEMARRAAAHHIYLVASIAELAGEVPHIRVSDHRELIQQVIQAWGDAPKPIAWGLGDEPRTEYMSEMAAYVSAWRTHAPGEPVTTVVMYNDVPAADKARFTQLAADIYPFFSKGNPNAYQGDQAHAWINNSRKLASLGSRPWMMGQSFQEPWGPYEIDTAGNVVYLPGGAPHWVFPTPEQISWQALAAFATGSKGMFYYRYRDDSEASPIAAATNLPAAVQARTNSQAPRAMVYPDGRPTPQYDAMSEAFSWIAKRTSILAPLKESAVPEAWEVEPAASKGNVVSMLVDPATQKRWLMVVASYDQPAGAPVRFRVGPHILGLKAAANGTERAILTLAGSFRTGEVLLAPGTAALFACSVDANNLP